MFGSRYKAILAERDSYLLELVRRRAKSAACRQGQAARNLAVEQLPCPCGQAGAPEWLQTDSILAQFGQRQRDPQICSVRA